MLDLAAELISGHLLAPGSTVLVFLPTYNLLEAMYKRVANPGITVHALHSSIDLDVCLRAIEDQTDTPKLILATAIADSSITIPGASSVVDFCRAVEVECQPSQRSVSRIVWASNSVCDQRKGRTGRTCNGTIYRMIPKWEYRQLPKWETPAIKLASLEDPALLLQCSQHPAMRDAEKVLAACLDAPRSETVVAAMSALGAVGALHPDGAPTQLGELLCSMPLALSNGLVVVHAARQGLLREGVLLAAIRSTTPFPIARHFTEDEAHGAALKRFGAALGNEASNSEKMLAHAAAFLFWRKYVYTKQAPHELAHGAAEEGPPQRGSGKAKREEEWCNENHISIAALHAVLETVYITTEVVHRMQPAWLRCNDPTELHTEQVGSSAIWDDVTRRVLRNVLSGSYARQQEAVDTSVCRYYLEGRCNRGSACPFLHTASAGDVCTPRCKFYIPFKPNSCREGQHCKFRHDCDPKAEQVPLSEQKGALTDLLAATRPVFPPLESHRGQWPLPESIFNILLLGEGNCSFAAGLQQRHPRINAVATTLESEAMTNTLFGESAMARVRKLRSQPGWDVLHQVDACALHTRTDAPTLLAECDVVQWNFPYTGKDADDTGNQDLMSRFFSSLQNLVLRGFAPSKMEVRLFLQGDQFSRWHVLRAARASHFDLYAWHDQLPLAEVSGYVPTRNSMGEPFPYHRHILYRFRHRDYLLIQRGQLQHVSAGVKVVRKRRLGDDDEEGGGVEGQQSKRPRGQPSAVCRWSGGGGPGGRYAVIEAHKAHKANNQGYGRYGYGYGYGYGGY